LQHEPGTTSTSEHVLDALVFQFTAFMTVGYGTHPRNFVSEWSQAFVIFYLVSGMVIMGVVAGSIGEHLLQIVDDVSNRANMLLEETIVLGTNVAVGTVSKSTGLVASTVVGVAKAGLRALPGEHRVRAPQAEVEDEELGPPAPTRRLIPSDYKRCIVSLAAMGGIIVIGAAAAMGFDNHSFITALYATVITVSTVGFGDIYPESTGARVFMVCYVPIGVLFFANALNKVSAIPLQIRTFRLNNFVLKQFGTQLTEDDFMDLKRSVDLDFKDDMSKNDFSLAMLLRLGKITLHDLAPIEEEFFHLDIDRSGKLTKADLADLTEKAQKVQMHLRYHDAAVAAGCLT
jgi:hypothetical protein